MVTKPIYQTELNNSVIKQGYIMQLCNAVTQRHDETLYRAAVLALYQTKDRRSGGLFRFTRLKHRSAKVRQARQAPATPHPTRAYIRARELELELKRELELEAEL